MGLFKRRVKRIIEVETLPSVSDNTSVRLDDGAVLNLGNAQDAGARAYQEDSYGFSDLSEETVLKKGVFAVLADGMGGLENGKAVSDATVRMMLQSFNNYPERIAYGAQLRSLIEKVSDVVTRNFNLRGSTSGTTLVSVAVNGSDLIWASVGDSRLYLIRRKHLFQVTEDGDYLNDLLDAVLEGDIEAAEAFGNAQRNALPHFIGSGRNLKIDYSHKSIALRDGDVILICSDGVYNAIPPETILDCMSDTAQKTANLIKSEVLARGHTKQDNLTAIVMEYKNNSGIGTTAQFY